MKLIHSAILFGGIVLAANGQENYGCFSSVDIANDQGTFTYQTPTYCLQKCLEYDYVALKNGTECYCLNSIPTTDNLSSDSCVAKCAGYVGLTCGGENSYEVYGSNANSTESESTDNVSSVSEGRSTPSISESCTTLLSSIIGEITSATESSFGNTTMANITSSSSAPPINSDGSSLGSFSGSSISANSSSLPVANNGVTIGGSLSSIASILLIALAFF